jgi:exosortase/archaeosortase family protein
MRAAYSGGLGLPSPRHLLWRGVGFGAVFASLQLAWQGARGTGLESFVIHTCIVRPAAVVVNFLTPDVHAHAIHFSLRARGGGLDILNGCDGLEALFLLIGAFAVVPLPWRLRVPGLLLGTAVVYLVNQARILTLFYAYRADHALFDTLHASVTPIAVILLVAGYFYVWLVHSSRRLALAS